MSCHNLSNDAYLLFFHGNPANYVRINDSTALHDIHGYCCTVHSGELTYISVETINNGDLIRLAPNYEAVLVKDLFPRIRMRYE